MMGGGRWYSSAGSAEALARAAAAAASSRFQVARVERINFGHRERQGTRARCRREIAERYRALYRRITAAMKRDVDFTPRRVANLALDLERELARERGGISLLDADAFGEQLDLEQMQKPPFGEVAPLAFRRAKDDCGVVRVVAGLGMRIERLTDRHREETSDEVPDPTFLHGPCLH